MTEDETRHAEFRRVDGRIDTLEASQSELWKQWNRHRDKWMTEVRSVVSESEQRAREHADTGDRNVGNAMLLKFVGIVAGIQALAIIVDKLVGA